MKKTYPFLFIFLFYFFYFSQQCCRAQTPGQWVWINGDNFSGSAGSFGNQGIPAITNEPPALYEACEWTDLNGNFWFYGGVDQSYGTHNDLWKYDPVANEWTWMTGTNTVNDLGVYGVLGVPSLSNRPPARGWGITSWTDANNNLWFFAGYNSNYYNDLWKYDISTNEWTWMKGPNITGQVGVYGTIGVPDSANIPGSRAELDASWSDNSGNLWFFGGQMNSPYYSFNDLWRFNIATNVWTWMKGTQLMQQPSIYGIRGVETSTNAPGGRTVYSHWKDVNGNFWMFGGFDYYNQNSFNDLWRYNPVTNNWTWINGDTVINQIGRYGTKCLTVQSNKPGGRNESRAVWTDSIGNFWMYGGDFLNDLWKYCVTANEWTWEGGDTVSNPAGYWGILGTSSPLNKPDGRSGSIGWTDHHGHLFLFGGSTAPVFTNYNDLWEFTIDTTCGTCPLSVLQSSFTPTDTTFCGEGTKCINFTDHSTGNPTSWQWQFPGATPDSSLLQNPTNICYANPGTYPVTLIVSNSAGTDTLTVSPMITFSNGAPNPIISLNHDTLVCSTPGIYSYLWYFNGLPIAGATDSFYVEHTAGTYSVYVTDSLGCSRISSGEAITSINESTHKQQLDISPNPVITTLIINAPLHGGILRIFNSLGEKMKELKIENGKTEIPVSDLASGIYYLTYWNDANFYSQKFIKE